MAGVCAEGLMTPSIYAWSHQLIVQQDVGRSEPGTEGLLTSKPDLHARRRDIKHRPCVALLKVGVVLLFLPDGCLRNSEDRFTYCTMIPIIVGGGVICRVVGPHASFEGHRGSDKFGAGYSGSAFHLNTAFKKLRSRSTPGLVPAQLTYYCCTVPF